MPFFVIAAKLLSGFRIENLLVGFAVKPCLRLAEGAHGRVGGV